MRKYASAKQILRPWQKWSSAPSTQDVKDKRSSAPSVRTYFDAIGARDHIEDPLPVDTRFLTAALLIRLVVKQAKPSIPRTRSSFSGAIRGDAIQPATDHTHTEDHSWRDYADAGSVLSILTSVVLCSLVQPCYSAGLASVWPTTARLLSFVFSGLW